MGKKDQEIATLKAEINKLQKRMGTEVLLTLAKYCSEIEKSVNDPRFVPGSLKLMPRATQAPAVDVGASDIELVIYAEHEYREPEKKKSAELKKFMKKCIDCDFWCETKCRGLLRDEALVNIVVAGGHSAPDGVFTGSNFGCRNHSGYIDGQVKYVHTDCKCSFSKTEVDGFCKPSSTSSFKICPNCNRLIDLDDLEVEIIG